MSSRSVPKWLKDGITAMNQEQAEEKNRNRDADKCIYYELDFFKRPIMDSAYCHKHNKKIMYLEICDCEDKITKGIE